MVVSLSVVSLGAWELAWLASDGDTRSTAGAGLQVLTFLLEGVALLERQIVGVGATSDSPLNLST